MTMHYQCENSKRNNRISICANDKVTISDMEDKVIRFVCVGVRAYVYVSVCILPFVVR